MDLSTIIVVVALTGLALVAVVWLEIYSRGTHPTISSPDQAGSCISRNTPSKSTSERGPDRV